MSRRVDRQSARGSARGASFLEIILALAIFVLATCGIIGAYVSCEHLSQHATASMQAVDHLDTLVERIYATEFDDLAADFPDGDADGPAGNPYTTIVGGYTLENEQIVVTYPSVSTGRREILVTLNWTFGGRAETTRFSTIRTSG